MLFALTTLLSAFLLFQIQPLIARVILPAFGGTPMVWTACMLFFQALLTGGYGYGHLVATKLAPKQQARVHTLSILLSVGLLGLATLRWGNPLIPQLGDQNQASTAPLSHIVRLLAMAVGIPYLVLSTTGPLIQSWSRLSDPSRSPYRLYALSNIGSLAGLLLYPTVIELAFGLHTQAWLFAGLYLAFALAVIACGRGVSRVSDAAVEVVGSASARVGASPSWTRYLTWTALAAIASALLLSTTNQLCQDVAAIPLLWVVPLSLYLLSFILAFAEPRWRHGYYQRWLWMPVFMIASGVALHFLGELRTRVGVQIPAWSTLLFSGCMVCHGELQRSRPEPRYLTGFWFAVSVGGALGGLFVSVLAPQVFRGYFEIHASIAACALAVVLTLALGREEEPASDLRPARASRRALQLVSLFVGSAWAVALIFGLLRHAKDANAGVVSVSRSFFGVLRVTEDDVDDPKLHRRLLTHGRIIHGMQFLSSEGSHTPCTYYEPESGVGRAIRLHPRRALGLSLGMCGLGTGTIAAYTRPEDTLRFYEIDPDVVALSRGPAPLFRYLADARGKVDVVMGDARVSLARELAQHGSNGFDVLAVDAFSGDAIPVHLLTREAVQLYLQHLKPDGVLALHISNRHLALFPVVRAIADSLSLKWVLVDTDYDDDPTAWSSTWVLVGRDAAALAPYQPSADPGPGPVVAPFTDEFSNIMKLLKL